MAPSRQIPVLLMLAYDCSVIQVHFPKRVCQYAGVGYRIPVGPSMPELPVSLCEAWVGAPYPRAERGAEPCFPVSPFGTPPLIEA